MRRIAVGDIMTHKVISAKPTDSLLKCAKLMTKARIDTLPISDNKKLVGIIASRDILWTITKKPSKELRKIKAIDIATKKVAVIKPSAEISQALEKMKALNFKTLPILSKGELIGIVTLKDILSVEPEIYSEISELMDVREMSSKKKLTEQEWPEADFCHNCGNFSELLKVENSLLCPDCRDELY